MPCQSTRCGLSASPVIFPAKGTPWVIVRRPDEGPPVAGPEKLVVAGITLLATEGESDGSDGNTVTEWRPRWKCVFLSPLLEVSTATETRFCKGSLGRAMHRAAPPGGGGDQGPPEELWRGCCPKSGVKRSLVLPRPLPTKWGWHGWDAVACHEGAAEPTPEEVNAVLGSASFNFGVFEGRTVLG